MEETRESYEKQIREIEAEAADKYKQLTDKLYLIETKEEAADKFLQDRETLNEKLAEYDELLKQEKALRLEQVNQKELDRIKETE